MPVTSTSPIQPSDPAQPIREETRTTIPAPSDRNVFKAPAVPSLPSPVHMSGQARREEIVSGFRRSEQHARPDEGAQEHDTSTRDAPEPFMDKVARRVPSIGRLARSFSRPSLRADFRAREEAPPVPELPTKMPHVVAKIDPSESLRPDTLEQFIKATSDRGIDQDMLQDFKDALDGKKDCTKHLGWATKKYQDEFGDNIGVSNALLKAAQRCLDENYKERGNIDRPRLALGEFVASVNPQHMVSKNLIPAARKSAERYLDFKSKLAAIEVAPEEIDQMWDNFVRHKVRAENELVFLREILGWYEPGEGENLWNNEHVQRKLSTITPSSGDENSEAYSYKPDENLWVDEGAQREAGRNALIIAFPDEELVSKVGLFMDNRLRSKKYFDSESGPELQSKLMRESKEIIINRHKEFLLDNVRLHMPSDTNTARVIEEFIDMRFELGDNPDRIRDLANMVEKFGGQFKSEWVLHKRVVTTTSVSTGVPPLTIEGARDLKAWLSKLVQQAIAHLAEER